MFRVAVHLLKTNAELLCVHIIRLLYCKEFTYWKLNSYFGVCSSLPPCQYFLLLSFMFEDL